MIAVVDQTLPRGYVTAYQWSEICSLACAFAVTGEASFDHARAPITVQEYHLPVMIVVPGRNASTKITRPDPPAYRVRTIAAMRPVSYLLGSA